MPARQQLRKVLLWLVCIGLLLVAGALVGVRLAVPRIDYFRPQIAELVSDMLGQTVSINLLQAQWRGWNTLDLTMGGVRLLNDTGSDSALELKRAHLTIDIFESALRGELLPGNLVVAGARIILTREPDGTFAARGLEDDEAAPTTGTAPNAKRDAYATWVLKQTQLGLKSATLIWHDRRAGRAPITLNDVNIHTSFDGENRHRANGTAALPSDLGQILTFDLDITGDPLSGNWSGSVGLRADAVHLSALSGIHDRLGLTRAEGRLNVDLNTHWAETRLTASTGSYQLDKARLDWPTGSSSIEDAQGTFHLERQSESWTLDLVQEHFSSRFGVWPPVQARLEFSPGDASQSPATFSARINYVRVEDLLPLAVAFGPTKLHTGLSDLNIQGEINDLAVNATLGEKAVTGLNIAGTARNLGTPSGAHTPGLAGLSGRFEADLHAGKFSLDSDRLMVTVPGVFAQPLQFSTSRGEIVWKRRGTGWWFDTSGLSVANAHLAGEFIGKLHWPYGNTLPIVDMAVEFDADLARIDNFLPSGLVHSGFAAWMQRAIKAGRLSDAQIRYRGYAGDFPFNGSEEGFLAHGRLENVDLEYSTHWPEVSGLNAEFSLQGSAFALTAFDGNVFGASITAGNAHIPNLAETAPVLSISTQLTGPAENGLRFLREGALAKRFGKFATALEVDGDVTMDLDVSVPLPSGKKTAEGTITLLDNTLALKKVNVTLTDVNGQLMFSPGTMTATNVESVYLETPIIVDVGRSAEAPGSTQLTIQGAANNAFLLRQLHALALFADPTDPPRILSHINGAAQWQATVDLPDTWGKDTEQARLRVVSTLEGLSITLPAPFNKSQPERKRLLIDTRFAPGAGRNVKIRFGSDIGGQFELRPDKEGYLLTRGAVAFGDSLPELPPRDGLYVSGQLERLSIDHWSEVIIEPGRSKPTDRPSDYPILRVLEEVEIATAEFELLGNAFDATDINVTRNEQNRWTVHVAGDSVKGEVIFPRVDERGEPVFIALDQLRLGKMEAHPERHNRYDPKRLPPLRFSANNLIYDEVNIGSVKFSTSPQTDGLSIDSLSLLSEGLEVISQGTWKLVDAAQSSHFVVELHADELDQLLQSLGNEESTAKGGATDILMTLDWPGSPSEFSLERMSGVVHLKASRGRLLDINPGATGRLFGFLLMTSLPRRLKLDFSDLFDEGLDYELIEGSFALENGHAYTNNLLVDSKSARIEIAGRTGLLVEDYDQVVTITPRLASSLPLAPVWLLEKVLQKKVFDNAFSYQYTITGDWDDPQIERIAIETLTKTGDDEVQR